MPDGRDTRHVDESRFLRGVPITNQRGVVEFSSIYPGWYVGRAIHIHLNVHIGGAMARRYLFWRPFVASGQLFFPEEITEQKPCAKRLDVHRTMQEQDGIFSSQQGSSSIVHLEKASSANGLVATVNMAIDPELTPRPVGRAGRGQEVRRRAAKRLGKQSSGVRSP